MANNLPKPHRSRYSKQTEWILSARDAFERLGGAVTVGNRVAITVFLVDCHRRGYKSDRSGALAYEKFLDGEFERRT
jgi:hypothetical protein